MASGYVNKRLFNLAVIKTDRLPEHNEKYSVMKILAKKISPS